MSIQIALELKRLIVSGRNVFVKMEPEVFDFTVPDFSGELVFWSATEELRLTVNKINLMNILGLVNAALFYDINYSIIGWNIKNFISFVKFYTKSNVEWECKFLDLKLLESFLGISEKTPNSFLEAMGRVKTVMSDSSWSKAKKIWQEIHKPLIFDVIPSLESQGIYNSKTREALYAYYEIEGQVNGRLKCSGQYKHSYVPHSMGPEQRDLFRPKGSDEIFIYFDFRHMEVSMLQWLSNDERLGQVLALDEDFYSVVFKLVSGNVCDTQKKRDMCKGFFLPVVYGMSADTLSKELGISQNTAESIVDRIYKLFPMSLKWVQACYDNADVVAVDYFGRKRSFHEKRWAIRDFVVQSPASLVCMEKLIALHHKLKGYARLACHIHDGYVIYANKTSTKMVIDMSRSVLEQDSDLCRGLKLKSTCKIGPTLNELSVCN